MDFNEYSIQLLSSQQLQEAREAAERRGLIARHRAARPGLRARLGATLIALGERLAAAAATERSYVAPGTSRD